MKKRILLMLILFYIILSPSKANCQERFPNLESVGAKWGIWIDNGLVNPNEVVRITASVPLNTLQNALPSELEIHPRYLEKSSDGTQKFPLKWRKVKDAAQWQAQVKYRPKEAGNYYAAMNFYNKSLFSYFAAWAPNLTVVNFWMNMPTEYHDANNLKDLYLPEVKAAHLPIDYELVMVGELVFKPDWEPRKLFRLAQVETGAEVIPFLDGGYFHKLDSQFTHRFEAIKSKVTEYQENISAETRAVHGLYKLPDPTFQPLSEKQCSAVIEGAQRYWNEWGFRPFTGVSTYSPSNALVASCRKKGINWLSGVFADYDFTDGSGRWEVGWLQKHRGMPSFPYLISETDFRWTNVADGQGTMMFPGWQNLPIYDHEDKHEHGTDIGTYNGYTGMTPLERMMLYSDVFERNNRLAGNKIPMTETFCIQMNNPKNAAILTGLADRAKQGKLIFIHKRYLQTYYREHHIIKDPNLCYTTPDSIFAAGRRPTYNFANESVWEGPEGKAAFISSETAPLPEGRSHYLPVWWYDYRDQGPLSPMKDLPSVDLSGITTILKVDGRGKNLVINSTRTLKGLPVCLWGLDLKPSSNWIKNYRAMKVAAPKTYGENAYMWIIRPDISEGKNIITL